MIVAKQIPPDLQQSPIDLTYVEWEGMAVDGNSRLKTYYCNEYEQTKDFLSYCLSYAWDEAIDTDKQLLTIVKSYLSTRGDISVDVAKKIWNILVEFDNSKLTMSDAIIKVLSIWCNSPWKVYTIRGSVQGEWQDVYYNSSMFSIKDIETFEKDYFNLGTEWKITDEDNQESWNIYCYEYDDEKLKKEIAESINHDLSDIVFEKFDGYEQVPKYINF